MAKLKQTGASRERAPEVPLKGPDSALATHARPAYFCPHRRATLLRMDVECVARLMTVMTCVTCSVTSSIADVIGTAKTFTARAEVDREEEEKQHKHEHRMIFLLQDPEGPATYSE